ncbi:MAG: carboxypeptidase-like regulatory domain-containing protein [Bacteroidales bacterium]|nr:carboxypeptidase-like regulatory domain-containing protein [Bacteroidales bacterium]
MRQRIIILLVFLFNCAALFAQQDTLRLAFSVQGVVVDAATNRPMESVLVSAPDASVATVTNADGRFTLKSTVRIERVSFSHIGYNTVVHQVVSGNALRIRMMPVALTLSEAVIFSGDPLHIVQSAIGKIEANYSLQPELLRCFYRETVRKRNRYTYISEAVARIYKTGYGEGVWRDKAALEKSRVLLSQKRSDTLSVKVQGGPTQALYLDAVKNRDMIFNKEELTLYDFRMEQSAVIDGRMHFVISFSPATQDTERALYYGTLYIDCERLSFTRIEMSMDMSDPGRATRQIVVKKPFSLRFKPREMSFLINYSMDGGTSRLAYFRSTFRFNCDWKKRLFATSYTVVNELVVTDIIHPAVQITKGEAFRTSDILSDKASEFMDPDFWRDYNIIEPSESLEHAVNRLRRQ